ILSIVYLVYTNTKSKEYGDVAKSMLSRTVWINVFVLLLDVTALVFEYIDLYDYQIMFKALLYAVKIKAEFWILEILTMSAKQQSERLGAGGTTINRGRVCAEPPEVETSTNGLNFYQSLTPAPRAARVARSPSVVSRAGSMSPARLPPAAMRQRAIQEDSEETMQEEQSPTPPMPLVQADPSASVSYEGGALTAINRLPHIAPPVRAWDGGRRDEGQEGAGGGNV
ncbi:hypothetical protein HK101_002330, partial [Irineochytrium annulatum]